MKERGTAIEGVDLLFLFPDAPDVRVTLPAGTRRDSRRHRTDAHTTHLVALCLKVEDLLSILLQEGLVCPLPGSCEANGSRGQGQSNRHKSNPHCSALGLYPKLLMCIIAHFKINASYFLLFNRASIRASIGG